MHLAMLLLMNHLFFGRVTDEGGWSRSLVFGGLYGLYMSNERPITRYAGSKQMEIDVMVGKEIDMS
jgi:hypothetical protein